MALIDDLAARLKETTDDLEAAIDARYPRNGTFGYADERRRFERDMAPVRAARKLLADYEADKGRDVDLTPGTVDYANLPEGTIIPKHNPLLGAPLTVIQQPADYVPFVKPSLRQLEEDKAVAGAALHLPELARPDSRMDIHTPQLDALLCELGALGVRLDVLAGK